jgi:hypothetical protein
VDHQWRIGVWELPHPESTHEDLAPTDVGMAPDAEPSVVRRGGVRNDQGRLR